MSEPTPRRLTIADLALMVVGAALGLFRIRQSIQTRATPIAWDTVVNIGVESTIVISSFLIAFSSTVLISRLISPRPSLRTALLQPGSVAYLIIISHAL